MRKGKHEHESNYKVSANKRFTRFIGCDVIIIAMSILVVALNKKRNTKKPKQGQNTSTQ